LPAKRICVNVGQTPGEVANMLLTQHLKSAAELLKTLPIQRKELQQTYKAKTLHDLVLAGVESSALAVAVLTDYVSELKQVTRCSGLCVCVRGWFPSLFTRLFSLTACPC
jgi:hypothetical protein